ncbi:Tox-REase-5 domain-containing protein [Myxococcus faecalis]|uniref:Tox-REase-5 domain-containing protein n=1 Tax=Myxococcus faecalis TaxID=3115646 RepID=UPI003CF6DA27
MRAGLWVVGVALLFVGCAGAESSTRRDTFHQRAGLPGERWSVSGEDPEREQEAEEADTSSMQPLYRRHMFRESVSLGAGRRQQDAFDVLLQSAGLEERDTRPVAGSSLSPTHAARLLKTLLKRDVTLGQFPARVAVGFLLREVLATGEVSRGELVRRVARFNHLAVLRPDGRLAWVHSGRTQQRVGDVEWKDGAFRAHGFELGRFYDGRTGVFRLLNDELREENGFPLADVHDDADVISRTLDGAEEAFVGLALAVGKFFSTSPADNLAALREMPAAVVALLESSPEYLERFQYMTRGEQVQAVSRLVTNLVATWGTVSAATRTLGGTGFATSEVPALVLAADGTVAMRLVSASTGRAAAVLSGGPGAAIVLQRAGEGGGSSSTPPAGPGGMKSYSSFKSFKRAMGPAGPGKEWHHIVEQTDGNVGRFGPKAIHNTENVVALDKELHMKVSAFYSSNQRISGGKTVREWLRAQSYEAQREFGLNILRDFGALP